MKGYWKRGRQYWHIKGDETLLINMPEDKKIYNGDCSIFFNPYDSPVFVQEGRVKITKEEFDKVKSEYIQRISQF